MARTYENFDVDLIVSGTTYEAVFRSLPDEPRLQLEYPLEQHELSAFLAMFGGQQRRRMEAPEFTRARAVGQRLFEALFAGDLSSLLVETTYRAMQASRGVRIRLELSRAEDLGNLPWEYMHSRHNDDFLALSNWTPVVRYLDVAEPLPSTPLLGPLRVLVMISDPVERRGTLDVEREWDQLCEALREPEARGEVEIHRLRDGQLETLMFELQDHDYHVFHFIGHGEYSEQHTDGVLALEDARGREVHIPGSTLGTYLRDSIEMRLVVLNNCEGAAFESDPFAGSAQSLLRKGIPAIVAMQFQITDRAAIDFARGFYTSLGKGFPVDAALAEARKVIRAGPTRIEFGSPVLYMSASDGVLFTRHEEVEIPDETEQHDIVTPLAVLVGDRDEPGTTADERGGIENRTAPTEPEETPTQVLEPEPAHEALTPAGLVESPSDQETVEVGDAPTDGKDRARWTGGRSKAVLGGLGAAVVVGAALTVNLLTADPASDATTQPTTVAGSTIEDTAIQDTPTTVATTTPSPTATPFVVWSRVPDQPSLGGAEGQAMFDVAPLAGGWVAVGAEIVSGVRSPAAWASADGREWERLPDDAFPGEPVNAEMRSLVAWDNGLLAVGVRHGDDDDASVWTTEDGRTWTAAVGSDALGGPGEQHMRSVTSWDQGLVAVGHEVTDEGSDGAVWTSSDGVEWRRVIDPNGSLGGEGGQVIHDVVAGGPGLVAVGETRVGDFIEVAVWTSADGVDWERVESDEFSGDGHRLANSLRAGPGSLLAGGFVTRDGTRDGALWTSSDGVVWTPVGDEEVLGGPFDQEIHALLRVGSGWVAAGWTHQEDDRNAAIWASDDGVAWTRVDGESALLGGPGDQQIESVALAEADMLAVGVHAGDIGSVSTFDATAWLGLSEG